MRVTRGGGRTRPVQLTTGEADRAVKPRLAQLKGGQRGLEQFAD